MVTRNHLHFSHPTQTAILPLLMVDARLLLHPTQVKTLVVVTVADKGRLYNQQDWPVVERCQLLAVRH